MAEIQRCGDSVGDGTAMKLITNALIYVHAAALAEGLAVAREAGLGVKLTIEAISNSCGSSYSSRYHHFKAAYRPCLCPTFVPFQGGGNSCCLPSVCPTMFECWHRGMVTHCARFA